MTTVNQIVERVNQLSIRRNLTWSAIKVDADNAIHRINSFLGATYPMMSEVFATSETYTIRQDEVDVEIFPDKYIHTIVIPFIAMEVLARDEEFTTIYNKYAQELDNGLFDMFQNEFNRVPQVFRQNPDAGVFFASGAKGVGARVRHNQKADLPTFKFRVHYHYNRTDLSVNDEVIDTVAYEYGSEATVLGVPFTQSLISDDGTKAYTFDTWYRHINPVNESPVDVGSTLIMKSDVHLYASWHVTDTLVNDVMGVVRIKDEFIPRLTRLELPATYQGRQIRRIPTNFLLHSMEEVYATQLKHISLPRLLTHIDAYAFTGFTGETIYIAETPLSALAPAYAGLTIAANAFMGAHNLRYMLIPANVVAIGEYAFPSIPAHTLYIHVRIFRDEQTYRVAC